MLKKLRRYLGISLSFLLTVYGFYLLFWFFYDTAKRTMGILALPFSLALTLSLFSWVMYYWKTRGKLPL